MKGSKDFEGRKEGRKVRKGGRREGRKEFEGKEGL